MYNRMPLKSKNNMRNNTILPSHKDSYNETESKMTLDFLKAQLYSQNQNYNKPQFIDTSSMYQHELVKIDNVFGKFFQGNRQEITIRGKLEFQNKFQNENGETYAKFTMSNPKTLYRNLTNINETKPFNVFISYSKNLLSGMYVQIKIPTKNLGRDGCIIIDDYETQVTEIKYEPVKQKIWMNYGHFKERFNKDFMITFSNKAASYKRNLELDNIDMVLMTKIAGENYENQVKGSNAYNIGKMRRDSGELQLSTLKTFIDKVTPSQNFKTTRSAVECSVGSGDDLVKEEATITRNLKYRNYKKTPYKNLYTHNRFKGLNDIEQSRATTILNNLKADHENNAYDYMNPIEFDNMPTKTKVKRELAMDKETVYSSKLLFLQTQLLPIKTKIGLINDNPTSLRVASMLRKYEKVIHNLGVDDVMKYQKIDEDMLDKAKSVRKDNLKEVEDFLYKRQ